MRRQRLFSSLWRVRRVGGTYHKACQFRREGFLDALGIGCRESDFFRKAPLRPDCSVVSAAKTVKFSEKGVAQFN